MKKKVKPNSAEYFLSELTKAFPEKMKELKEELKVKRGWVALTIAELQKMSNTELKKVKTLCWKDENFRYEDKDGITDLVISDRENETYYISWSNNLSDPSLRSVELEEKIDKLTYDGTWFYGLYKKVK